MAKSIKITNENGLVYQFFDAEVKSLNYSIQVQNFTYEVPGGDGTDNLSINLGRKTIIQFPFKLLNTSGNDASDGTHTSTVETIQEKLDYILDNIITDGIENFYFLDITTHTGSRTGIKATLDGFQWSPTSTNPESAEGKLSFEVGGGNQ